MRANSFVLAERHLHRLSAGLVGTLTHPGAVEIERVREGFIEPFDSLVHFALEPLIARCVRHLLLRPTHPSLPTVEGHPGRSPRALHVIRGRLAGRGVLVETASGTHRILPIRSACVCAT